MSLHSGTQRLLDRLQTGSVNPLQAWLELGIYRLGARIWDLRKAGYQIEKRIVEVKNQFGEKCHVAEYRLISEKRAAA